MSQGRGCRRRRIDDRHTTTELTLDDRRQQRVVRATEQQRVKSVLGGGTNGRDRAADDFFDDRPVQLARLDQRNQVRCSELCYAQEGVFVLDRLEVGV